MRLQSPKRSATCLLTNKLSNVFLITAHGFELTDPRDEKAGYDSQHVSQKIGLRGVATAGKAEGLLCLDFGLPSNSGAILDGLL